MRIKEKKWSLTVSGGTTGSFAPNEDNGTQPVNGEILEVSWQANRAGSLFLTTGDTVEEIFRRNAPSGDIGFQITRPTVVVQDTLGAVHDSSGAVPFLTNSPIWLQLESYVSGTQTLDVNVKYR